MQLVYDNTKVQRQCTDLKMAKKLFGGNDLMARSLFARINALQQANVLKDIVVMPTFHFHRDPWRIVLQPLDENKEPYDPCNIDEVAGIVRIVDIKEVSNHYE